MNIAIIFFNFNVVIKLIISNDRINALKKYIGNIIINPITDIPSRYMLVVISILFIKMFFGMTNLLFTNRLILSAITILFSSLVNTLNNIPIMNDIIVSIIIKNNSLFFLILLCIYITYLIIFIGY